MVGALPLPLSKHGGGGDSDTVGMPPPRTDSAGREMALDGDGKT